MLTSSSVIHRLTNVPKLDQQPEPVASIALLPGLAQSIDRGAPVVKQQPGPPYPYGSVSAELQISGVIHDFNNFLAIILSHTAIALNKLPTESPARTYLERAVRTTRRAADLSGQLLANVKSHKIEHALLDLNQIIEESIELLTPRLTLKCTIAVELASDLAMVVGNDVQFRQVMLNLLVNALEAVETTPGHITIVTHNLTVPETRYLHVDALPAGHYVCLQVSDSGVGMDQATLSCIFEPYFTTKLTGTGIGLSTILGIIQAHHGSIQVFSTPGYGTTFQVFLPTNALEEF